MRVARSALCLALVGSLTAVGAASAATKPKPKPVPPVCNLLTDAADDANGFLVTDHGLPIPSDEYLDILSADIASDAKNVTAVIRLKSMGADSTAPTGGTVYFNFIIGDLPVYLNADFDGSGTATYSAGDTSSGQRASVGTATGLIDAAKKEVHITTSVNNWGTAIKPGMKLSGLEGLAQRFVGAPGGPGATPTADEATSDKLYTAGAKSCVIPGK